MYICSQGLCTHLNLQEEDTRNEDDALTVITVILAAVITSILFAFKRHISTPSSTGVPKVSDRGKKNGGVGGLFKSRA